MKKLLAYVCLSISLLGFVAMGVYAAAPTRTAQLTWTQVTLDTDGNTISGVTYNVYQGARGAPLSSKTKVLSNSSALAYTATNLGYGETCWQVTSQTVALGEGGPTEDGCKSFALPKPASTTLTVQ